MVLEVGVEGSEAAENIEVIDSDQGKNR